MWYRTPNLSAIRSPIIAPVHTPVSYPATKGPASIIPGELASLGLVEPGRGSWRELRVQPFDALGLVPLQPAIQRASRLAQLCRELDDALALYVSEHRSPTLPLEQAAPTLCISDERVESLQRCCRTSRRADCLACLGPRHDHLS